MMRQTHSIVGGTTAFVVTTAVGLPMEVVAISIIGATVGSSLPDNVEKPLHLPHRKVSHWPAVQLAFFAAVAAMIVSQAPNYAVMIWIAAASIAFGCVMHSIADAMTVEKHGIQLLWPIKRRGYHLLPWSMRVWVGSKSRSEKVFVAIWVVFVLIYTYAHFGSLIYA